MSETPIILYLHNVEETAPTMLACVSGIAEELSTWVTKTDAENIAEMEDPFSEVLLLEYGENVFMMRPGVEAEHLYAVSDKDKCYTAIVLKREGKEKTEELGLFFTQEPENEDVLNQIEIMSGEQLRFRHMYVLACANKTFPSYYCIRSREAAYRSFEKIEEPDTRKEEFHFPIMGSLATEHPLSSSFKDVYPNPVRKPEEQ